MKAANFVNVLLSIAVVILCTLLYAEKKSHAESAEIVYHAESAESAESAEKKSHAESAEFAASPVGVGEPSPTDGAANVTLDSTGLAPGVTGYGGPVTVTVELTNGVVARVSPKLPNDETPVFFARLEAAGLWQAWDGLPAGVAATARVDAVTSATYSSEAAIANVRAALAAAAENGGKENGR